MTETVKQGKSLLERWHNATPMSTNPKYFQDRHILESELRYLLEGELCHKAGVDDFTAINYLKKKEVLEEFRENFTWQQSEAAKIDFYVHTSYVDFKDFDTQEELIEYLRKGTDNDIENPEQVEPYEMDFDFDGVKEVLPSVRVWSLKPINKKKSFEVVINVQGENWDEEEINRHFNLLFGEDDSSLQFDLKKVIAVQEQCPSV